MAPVKNGRLLFNENAIDGNIVPGKTTVYDESQTIDLDTVPLDGGFLLKVLVLSVDPGPTVLRLLPWVVDHPMGPFKADQPIDNLGVGVVLRSENPDVKAGDHLCGLIPFEQYTIQKNAKAYRKVERKPNVPWSAYVGVAGMPGETALYGWKEYANPQKGDVVFVSAAAGPVGATVVQIAKAEGFKVIASAGSDDKVKWVSSIGADVAFNYKETDTHEVLKKEGPINIYWDNVGGKTLEDALGNAARGARFIECGMISEVGSPHPIKSLLNIVVREVRIQGFLVYSLRDKYVDEFHSDFVSRISKGEIQYKEHIVRGLENGGQAIVDVHTGKNFGKAVVVVADD